MTARIAVLVSGNGSNLQALLDACRDGRITGRIVGVASNRSGVRALDRARTAGVDTAVVTLDRGESRESYDARLRDAVAPWRPDVVVLAGFMRILSRVFLDEFTGRVINVHPALPGELPGVGAIERAHAQAVTGERTRSGVMVHLVPDEGVDDGPVLATVEVAVRSDESFDDFAARMHAAEHRLLVDAVAHFLSRLSETSQGGTR
jgi:formyltetrahydrofolate-dependent phosphoribosylglycinamide formyltransferase